MLLWVNQVMSFQEVETDQFHNFFLPELQRDGYDGIFSAKSRARTMTEADRKHVDGCAIFFKTSKYVTEFIIVMFVWWFLCGSYRQGVKILTQVSISTHLHIKPIRSIVIREDSFLSPYVTCVIVQKNEHDRLAVQGVPFKNRQLRPTFICTHYFKC